MKARNQTATPEVFSPSISPKRPRAKGYKNSPSLAPEMRPTIMAGNSFRPVWRRMMLKLKIYFVFKKARDTVILNVG
jgi:hypothetical protein